MLIKDTRSWRWSGTGTRELWIPFFPMPANLNDCAAEYYPPAVVPVSTTRGIRSQIALPEVSWLFSLQLAADFSKTLLL